MSNDFAWIGFYEQIAQALGQYSDNREQLFDKLKTLASHTPQLRYLHFEHEQFWRDRQNQIDPFTVMAIFNRATTVSHRHDLAQLLANLLEVRQQAPLIFHGIAHLDPRHSIYSGNSQIWDLFDLALTGKRDAHFEKAFAAAVNVPGNGLSMLTIALFWVNPSQYMPLDKISDPLITSKYRLMPPQDKSDASDYPRFLDQLDVKLGNRAERYASLAYAAWQHAQGN